MPAREDNAGVDDLGVPVQCVIVTRFGTEEAVRTKAYS